MKKFLILFISIVMVIFSINFIACSPTDGANKEYDEIMNEAIILLKEGWEDVYSEQSMDNRENKIRIANSRIIEIKDTHEIHEISEFQNIKNVIEFVVYSDYYGTQGKYYTNVNRYDCVLVYKDGTMEFHETNIMYDYSKVRYDYSFSFISNVVELNSSYNQTISLNLN